MTESIIAADRSLFFLINGFHSEIFDFLMYWASNRFIWIPFYALLLYIFLKKTENKIHVLILLLAAGLMIAVSDQLTVILFKNNFHRLRPCHAPGIKEMVRTVSGCGGLYGFVSSHASNVASISALLVLLYNSKIRWLKYVMIPWAILICYSRIYLGAHYPADVFCGACFGFIIGYLFFMLTRFAYTKYS